MTATLPRVLLCVGLTASLAACSSSGPTTNARAEGAAGAPTAVTSEGTSTSSPTTSPGSAGSATMTSTAPTSATNTAHTTPPAATSTPTQTAANQPVDRSVRVRIHAPQYDAPGALVPIIPTARGARSFDVSTAAGRGECTGATWSHAEGTSQQCWITLPRSGSSTSIRVRAHLRDGHDAVGTTTIEAKGPVTSAVDAATRDAILTCGNTTRDVWLTFDDGFLSRAAQQRVLRILQRENVQARFFATGQWSRANPRLTRELLRAGHLVENHTDTHEALNTLGDAALRSQIARGPATHPTLLRPGFGAGAFTTRVNAAATTQGQRVCYWDVDTADWSGVSAATITHRVLHGDRSTPPARPGSVVLMHMTSSQTDTALPDLIHGLRSEGLTLPRLR